MTAAAVGNHPYNETVDNTNNSSLRVQTLSSEATNDDTANRSTVNVRTLSSGTFEITTRYDDSSMRVVYKPFSGSATGTVDVVAFLNDGSTTFNSNVYAVNNSSFIGAFTGDLSGTANKAKYDVNGNPLDSSYYATIEHMWNIADEIVRAFS